MNAVQQAAYQKMLNLETAVRFARTHEERERFHKQWKKLQAVVDG